METILMDVFFEVHSDLDRESPGGNEYTQQAFRMLPPLSQPNVLDVGCGPGAQTLELARLTDGTITAIDTHQPFLDCLQTKASALGLSDRITCLNQTMADLPFPEQAFDLIWAEGSIYIIGFEEGLKQWKPLIKPGGYFGVSELVWLQPDQPQAIRSYWQTGYPGMKTIDQVLTAITAGGYQVVGHFTMPEAACWNYYNPLEARVKKLSSIYAQDPEALAVLASEQEEIDMYRHYSEWYGYAFFVLQKPI